MEDNNLPFTDLVDYEEWKKEHGHLERYLDQDGLPDAYINDRFFCSCESKELVKCEYRNGTIHHFMQCVRCGNFESVRKTQETNKWRDESLRDQWYRMKRRARKEIKDATAPPNLIIDDRREKYQEYLLTPIWDSKRKRALKRDNDICQACLRNRATEVHHLVYPHKLGYEPLWTLKSVCSKCHRAIHDLQIGVVL